MALTALRQPVVDLVADALAMGYHVEVQTADGLVRHADVEGVMVDVDKSLVAQNMADIQVYNGHRHVATLIVVNEPEPPGHAPPRQ